MGPYRGLVHPSDGGRTHGRAYSGGGVEAVVLDAALGQGVDVGRFDEGVPVATEPTADVLQENPQDVGLGLGRGSEMKAHQSQGNEETAKQAIHWMMRVERVKGKTCRLLFSGERVNPSFAKWGRFSCKRLLDEETGQRMMQYP